MDWVSDRPTKVKKNCNAPINLVFFLSLVPPTVGTAYDDCPTTHLTPNDTSCYAAIIKIREYVFALIQISKMWLLVFIDVYQKGAQTEISEKAIFVTK